MVGRGLKRTMVGEDGEGKITDMTPLAMGSDIW